MGTAWWIPSVSILQPLGPDSQHFWSVLQPEDSMIPQETAPISHVFTCPAASCTAAGGLFNGLESPVWMHAPPVQLDLVVGRDYTILNGACNSVRAGRKIEVAASDRSAIHLYTDGGAGGRR